MPVFSTKTLNLAIMAAVGAASLSTAALAAPRMAPGFDFAAIDADKDGQITQAEVDAHRAAQMAGMDANNDGKISAEEMAAHFVAQMTQSLQKRAENRAKHMIVDLDSDGDGLLSPEELAAMGGNGARMFNRMDSDGDGMISRAEADAAMAKMGMRGEGRGEGRGKGGHGMRDSHGMGDGGKGGFGGFW